MIDVQPRGDGHLDVTYSLAPGRHFTAVVIPGPDAAAAVRKTGNHLAAIYRSQGYV